MTYDQFLSDAIDRELAELAPLVHPVIPSGAPINPPPNALVILETPYAGDIDGNVEFARACLLDCLQRGERPFASHLLYTQCLDDNVPAQRDHGITAGLAWAERADATIVYVDRGVSPGMLKGIAHAERCARPVFYRILERTT